MAKVQIVNFSDIQLMDNLSASFWCNFNEEIKKVKGLDRRMLTAQSAKTIIDGGVVFSASMREVRSDEQLSRAFGEGIYGIVERAMHFALAVSGPDEPTLKNLPSALKRKVASRDPNADAVYESTHLAHILALRGINQPADREPMLIEAVGRILNGGDSSDGAGIRQIGALVLYCKDKLYEKSYAKAREALLGELEKLNRFERALGRGETSIFGSDFATEHDAGSVCIGRKP